MEDLGNWLMDSHKRRGDPFPSSLEETHHEMCSFSGVYLSQNVSLEVFLPNRLYPGDDDDDDDGLCSSHEAGVLCSRSHDDGDGDDSEEVRHLSDLSHVLLVWTCDARAGANSGAVNVTEVLDHHCFPSYEKKHSVPPAC